MSTRRQTRRAISAWLKERFLLRLHMFWILTGTFLSGLIASWLLLRLGVDHLALRYAFVVVLAYLVFLLLIRLWLWYIGFQMRWEADPGVDAVDFFSNLSRGPSTWSGGGGDFGGGGATGSWGDAPQIQPVVAKPSVDASGGEFDFDGLIVILAFVAVALTIIMAGGYIIYAAPSILANAAVEAALAAALARRAKKIDEPDWVGSVFRATFAPALAVAIFAIVFGFIAEHYCPEANTLPEVIRCAAADRSL